MGALEMSAVVKASFAARDILIAAMAAKGFSSNMSVWGVDIFRGDASGEAAKGFYGSLVLYAPLEGEMVPFTTIPAAEFSQALIAAVEEAQYLGLRGMLEVRNAPFYLGPKATTAPALGYRHACFQALPLEGEEIVA